MWKSTFRFSENFFRVSCQQIQKCQTHPTFSFSRFGATMCSWVSIRKLLIEKPKAAILQPFCSKFTGEHPCRSVISIKLFCIFIEITVRHGCSPGNLLHIFRTPFSKSTSEWLLPKNVFQEYLLVYRLDPSDFLFREILVKMKIIIWNFLKTKHRNN